MHEEHTVYRVEENSRWDLQPGGADVSPPTPRDVAFSPTPVNEAILAEVNSQRLATAQIRRESQTLSISLAQFQNAMQSAQTNFQQTAALRAMIGSLKQRLEALESARPAINISTTNELFDPLRP